LGGRVDFHLVDAWQGGDALVKLGRRFEMNQLEPEPSRYEGHEGDVVEHVERSPDGGFKALSRHDHTHLAV
jgi:hypothetical protein